MPRRQREDNASRPRLTPSRTLDPTRPNPGPRHGQFLQPDPGLGNTRVPGARAQAVSTISPWAVNSGAPLDFELSPESLRPWGPNCRRSRGASPEALEPTPLAAEADIEEADRKDTDKFREETAGRRVPLQPTGSDAPTRIRSAAEPPELAPSHPSGGGAGRDKFYVADILSRTARRQRTGDTRLVGPPKGPPPSAQLDSQDGGGLQHTHARAARKTAPAGASSCPGQESTPTS